LKPLKQSCFFKEEEKMVVTRSMYKKPSTDILRNAPPLSDGRRNRKPEFVSIIRTRSQKVREYHNLMISSVGVFYMKKKKEPRLDSKESSEVELATYLHNIRHTELNVELVLKIADALPWFDWTEKNTDISTSENSGFLNIVAALLVIASFSAFYVALQMNIDETKRLVAWANEIIQRRVYDYPMKWEIY